MEATAELETKIEIEPVEQFELIEPVEQIEAPRLSPRVAAVDLQSQFRRMARLLWPKDYSTQDDLVQEMSQAALECKQDHTAAYFVHRGVSRAINYLRWWTRPMNEGYRKFDRTAQAGEELSVSAAVKRAAQALDRE